MWVLIFQVLKIWKPWKVLNQKCTDLNSGFARTRLCRQDLNSTRIVCSIDSPTEIKKEEISAQKTDLIQRIPNSIICPLWPTDGLCWCHKISFDRPQTMLLDLMFDRTSLSESLRTLEIPDGNLLAYSMVPILPYCLSSQSEVPILGRGIFWDLKSSQNSAWEVLIRKGGIFENWIQISPWIMRLKVPILT